jgi:signal transduction histidine kinase/DNA-binding response OmpR family regulator
MKKYSFSISRKVWLSLSIMIIGYLASMIFGFIRGSETETRLNHVSESVFPAAMQSKLALTKFNEQVKLYGDAVTLGEENLLEDVKTRADEVQDAFKQLVILVPQKESEALGIRELAKELRDFNAAAGTLYKGMLSEIEDDTLPGKAAQMNQRTRDLREKLTALTGTFSGNLKRELVNAGNTTRNQRYGNMIVFFLVVTISVFLVSIIINRSITGPLQKAEELAGAMAEGDLSRKLDIRQQDEIGGLARAMNVMAGEIEASHAMLEQKVADRTASLEETNQKLRAEIGERKRTEEELKKARDQLVESARAADEANRSKGEFLARMSHEIRTPMNSVIGFSEMLLETGLSEEQEDYAHTIARSGEALITIINDILDFSKIEAGKLVFESIDFDPEVTAFDVCELIKPRIEGRGVEILCRIGDRVPAFVRQDPGRFRQVLINLMGNAAKFTKKGEIELSVDVEEEEEERVKLICNIRDTGIGIPPDKTGNIFDVFQQADGSVTRQFGGTGLGLAISLQIARHMQGEISVESEPGKGSIFHFSAWVEKSKKTSALKPAKAELAGKRVLIADDNTNNLDILEHVLKKHGMTVVKLTGGEQVVPLLQQNLECESPFDLCILDVMMPGMSGYEVARHIGKLSPPLSNTPLLILSSDITELAKISRESRFDGFLPKPVSRVKLLKVMERLLIKGPGANSGAETVKKKQMVTQHSVVEDAKHSMHILLAEDNALNRKLANFMLTKAGYKLDMVENGIEAVETYASNPDKYDLILMDIQMPEMDGREATRRLRKAGYKDIPIIAMTAETMKGDYEKCIEAGMNDYIAKPIRRETVFKTIKKWVLIE